MSPSEPDSAGGRAAPARGDIPASERLIVALDVDDREEAESLVRRLGDSVTFYKIGLQLLMSGDSFALADDLLERGKKVFVDLKLFDVPETVAAAVRRLRSRGVHLTTVHGNDSMLEAAVREKGALSVLAVTVLTSLDRGDLDDLGFDVEVEELVLSRARRAVELGCDGVVSSGLEARRLRDAGGEGFLVVVPGIRPVENRAIDDQKRTVDVEDALRAGADHIVVGRPVRRAADPRAVAEDIQERISRLLADPGP